MCVCVRVNVSNRLPTIASSITLKMSFSSSSNVIGASEHNAAESMSGATEHVQAPLQRVAKDGSSYTETEFASWYGPRYRDIWDQAPAYHAETVDSRTPPTAPVAASLPVEQGGATEHSEPPNHAEHAQATNTAPEHGDPNRADPSSAPEPDDTHSNAQIIWSMQEARHFRGGFHGQQAAFHKEARDALNNLAQSAELGAAEHSLDDYFRWKQYVSLHKDYEDIIGTGIIAATAERIQETSDPNRAGQKRTDFVFYRNNNTWCRVHPGTKTKNDAQLRFGINRTADAQMSNMYQMIPEFPFTIDMAALIPQTDTFGKSDALAKLQTLQPGMLGVTEHDAFKWWLFFPTVDEEYKAEMFGPGICEVELCQKSTTDAVLRICRSDQSVKHLVLEKLGRKIKTKLCDDALEAINFVRDTWSIV